MTTKTQNIRYLSAKIILKIINGVSLREINFNKETNDNKNISLIKAITYGVLRHYWELEEISKEFLSKKLKAKDQDIFILLLIAFYELIYLNSKSFAVINETVEAAKLFKKIWAKNLLNACLRNFTRSNLDLEKFRQNYNHPIWLSDLIKKSWPNEYKNILIANNQKAPLTLRVNSKNITVQNFLEILEKNNIEYQTIPELEHAVIIKNPIAYEKIPGFDKGFFYVQDAASQLAVKLLEINSHDNFILDACAAPGGKTSYILQMLSEIKNDTANIISIDNNPNRVAKIAENLESLGLLNNQIKIITDNADNIESHINIDNKSSKFNKILLDAPCSATGVIRRHPDIKHHRTSDDITKLNDIQISLLKKIWNVLEKDGELLYCTCSILDEENENIIKTFINYLQQNNDKFELIKLNHPNFINKQVGIYSLPQKFGLFDGFYYCKIKKLS